MILEVILLSILANQVIIMAIGVATLTIWLVTMATALFIGWSRHVTCCTKRRNRTNRQIMVTNHKNK